MDYCTIMVEEEFVTSKRVSREIYKEIQSRFQISVALEIIMLQHNFRSYFLIVRNKYRVFQR